MKVLTTHTGLVNSLTQLKQNNQKLTSRELLLILEEIKYLCHDETLVKLLIKCLNSLLNQDISDRKTLTERESDVVYMISKGLLNNDIADALKVSKSTIETHRKNIRKKLNLKGKDSLFAFALVFCLQSNNHQIYRGI